MPQNKEKHMTSLKSFSSDLLPDAANCKEIVDQTLHNFNTAIFTFRYLEYHKSSTSPPIFFWLVWFEIAILNFFP